ncbi:hypothetical protein C943_04612 [Mariniradius saccharolyticus AK6]|uniref:Uncharacterized protein n=1 Tax=Mariniradius saccharolyticus AK6 TaxID=1239962 RepID=M7XGR2_9BACT|nr:hypothetical protein C943_04612 [Mariniradius saccharolyticus AK6]
MFEYFDEGFQIKSTKKGTKDNKRIQALLISFVVKITFLVPCAIAKWHFRNLH